MRQRHSSRLSATATIKRRQQSSKNELGEPIYHTETVASEVPCILNDESTAFVREDSGERVNKPATIRFGHDVDVEEGDTVTVKINGTTNGPFECRGVNKQRDHRRGRVQAAEIEVERSD